MSGKENRCPVCGGQMTAGKWYTQQGRRYLTKAHCETDGDFYIRVRLAHEDEALRVSRLVYEPTEQVAKSYAALAQKPRAGLHKLWRPVLYGSSGSKRSKMGMLPSASQASRSSFLRMVQLTSCAPQVRTQACRQ